VLDPLRETEPLECGKQPELSDLTQRGHESVIFARASSVAGSSAASAS
jgi:hypothetical protein